VNNGTPVVAGSNSSDILGPNVIRVRQEKHSIGLEVKGEGNSRHVVGAALSVN
jgi:hypothetical protein